MVKRTVDVLGSLALLVFGLPVLLATIGASVVTFRASPIFVQQRVGRGGRTFSFAKIRTMPPGTEPYAPSSALGDLRLPRWATWLRRHHLDELPQLVHVVTGQMSLIGPRPELPNLHMRLDPHFAEARVTIRPGLTGLWQVGAHRTSSIGEWPEYDERYLLDRGPLLDLWIMWRTVLKVVSGRTAVTIADIPDWTRSQRASDAERAAAIQVPETVAD